MKIDGIDLVRRCTNCNKPMAEGYCMDGGFAYYCTKECLLTAMTWEEFLDLYDDGDGDSYWTEWEEDSELVDLVILLEEAQTELEDSLSFMETFEDGDSQERAYHKRVMIDKIAHFLEGE